MEKYYVRYYLGTKLFLQPLELQRIKTSNIEELNIPAGVARFDIIKKFTENDTNRLKTEKNTLHTWDKINI